jgi:hypothetical protein
MGMWIDGNSNADAADGADAADAYADFFIG